nr:retrovirus-related Pol polyprotein from transposon TNT 1-94 [Tanacetum cinerariifolium]
MNEIEKAKKILGMEIVRDRSRKILRVSQSGMSKVPYANAVGSLMYLMACMRPDIAYTGAIHLSRNHVFYERTKHINVRYHFIREVLESKTVKVLKVGTEHNAEDALTKVVPRLRLQHFLELLNAGVG